MLVSVQASGGYVLDVCGERTMEYLSPRIDRISNNNWLHVVFSIFVDTDCNKRGQTSRAAARA